MARKLVGYLDDVPVYEDPDAPPNTMYFLNDNYGDFEINPNEAYCIRFSRWYRFKRWVKELLNNER